MKGMKTPHFNDFLEAFDILGIDTNEAIHYSPEKAETHMKPILVETMVTD